MKDMILEQGALQRIPEFLQKDPYTQYRNFAMVCDDHTYEAAGKEVERLIRGIKVIKLNPENLMPMRSVYKKSGKHWSRWKASTA